MSVSLLENYIDGTFKHYSTITKFYQDWIDAQYTERFSAYFSHVNTLYEKMHNVYTSITDSELEWILTTLPLELYSVSEKLNALNLDINIIKIEIKKKMRSVEQNSKESTVAKRKQEASDSVLLDESVLKAYESLVSLVESQISFCRELIMGSKKIWDARRRAESANPVGAVVPDYIDQENQQVYKNQYIKGDAMI